MNISAVSDGMMKAVLYLSLLSVVVKLICLFCGFLLCTKTLSFMKMHPERFGTDMGHEPRDTSGNKGTADQPVPWREYVRFLKIWDLMVLVADGTAIAGIQMLSNQGKENWTVRDLDDVTVLLGLGCLFAWVSLLKYFKIHHKFHMLFSTIYATIFDVLAYLSCICVLFVGYMLFGYLVLGPYNVKFQTTSSSLNTLFSIINGDEIYATFALLEENKIGSSLVPITYKIYLGSFIAIFTIVVLNLFIALFTNAYDAVKKQYEETDEQIRSLTIKTFINMEIDDESATCRKILFGVRFLCLKPPYYIITKFLQPQEYEFL